MAAVKSLVYRLMSKRVLVRTKVTFCPLQVCYHDYSRHVFELE
jgi:hypothetical protein